MPVLLRSDTRKSEGFDLERVQKNAAKILQECGHPNSELSILLVSDPQMRQLNCQYRQKDKPTNVLAFPLNAPEEIRDGLLLGDVVISLDTAAREARRAKTTLTYRVLRLLVHGLVHLLGYDHELSPHEARRMKEKESALLNNLQEHHRRDTMPHLAINVDHIATIRQARGTTEPDPVLAAGICELAGASGIVVHLREDRRHIQDRDVRLLRQTVQTKLNLEMGATEEIIQIALDIKPDMITLVPEKRKELTTEGGLNVSGQQKKLTTVIARMTKAGIPVSLFIDPDSKQIKASRDVGATFVEIHTGRYCDATTETEQNREFDMVAASAEEAYESGLRVNAGHGLNYQTTARIAALDSIEELSIGHAIISRAAFVGIDQAVREMLEIIKRSRSV